MISYIFNKLNNSDGSVTVYNINTTLRRNPQNIILLQVKINTCLISLLSYKLTLSKKCMINTCLRKHLLVFT